MLNWDPRQLRHFCGDTPYPERLQPTAEAVASATATAKTQSASRTANSSGRRWRRHHRLGRPVQGLPRDGYRFAVSLDTHWHGGKPKPV